MNENAIEYKEIPLLQCPFCGSNDIVSRRGNQQRMCMGCGAEGPEAKSRQGADVLWNHRTPEPGTSVIRWTRCDGTPETLPNEDVYVFVRKGSGSFPAMRIYTNFKEFIWKMYDGWIDIEIGDLWAYLPIPEGMQ